MYTQSIYTLLLALSIHIWSASAETLCYYPDGTVPSSPYMPCNSTAEGVHSACCSLGDVCSKQGYCLGHGGFLYRGGCTDQTWTSQQCCPQCRDTAIDSYSNLYHCGWNNGSQVGPWCCGGVDDTPESIAGCCNTTLFYPGSPEHPEFGGFFTPATELNISATSTSAPSATQSISKSGPSNPVPSSPGANLTANQNAPISKPQQQSHERVAIGLGVGIPFCLIASGSLLLLFREHKLRLRAESTARIINDKRFKGGEGSERGLHGSEDHNPPQELENELKDPNELDSQEVHEVAAHNNTYRLGWTQSSQVL